MRKIFPTKKKFIPKFLIPKVRKHHVHDIYIANEAEWKLFAEGALRNKIFHEDVINRGKMCLACDKSLKNKRTKTLFKIDKHHNCYMRLCIGNVLPENSKDIVRPQQNDEYSYVPDCRQCKSINPEYYEGCIKKIFPVHRQCHRRIHELEKILFKNLGKKLSSSFSLISSSQI